MPSSSLENSPGAQVRITHRAFDRELSSRLSELGLKSGYWYYLRVLWDQEGLTQRELSDVINVKETTTVTMITGMEADGLIHRKPHESDRRKSCIFLTKEGKKLKKELLPLGIAVNKIATQGITQSDIKNCLAVLHKMRLNLHAAKK